MTTNELKSIVEKFNEGGVGTMTVYSPAAYSQWRVSYKLTTGVCLFNWISVDDWNEEDTWKDIDLIGGEEA